MLMFTSTLLTMMSIGGFPSFVEDMKVQMLIPIEICLRFFLDVLYVVYLSFVPFLNVGVQKRAAEWSLWCYCICHF